VRRGLEVSKSAPNFPKRLQCMISEGALDKKFSQKKDQTHKCSIFFMEYWTHIYFKALRLEEWRGTLKCSKLIPFLPKYKES
jgi:hypothetical protein